MSLLDILETKEDKKADKQEERKLKPKPKQNIPEGGTEWGYDLYPERRGNKPNPGVTDVLFKGKGAESR